MTLLGEDRLLAPLRQALREVPADGQWRFLQASRLVKRCQQIVSEPLELAVDGFAVLFDFGGADIAARGEGVVGGLDVWDTH